MKKVFIPLLFSICLLCMTGCASTNGQIQTTDTPSNDATVMEKHIVSITADNYQKFLTVEKNVVDGGSSSTSYHYFRGALSYAFYDNVIITYNYHSSGTSGDTITEKKLSLNAGGCGTIITSNSRYGNSSYEITNVTGTRIYWI